MFWPEFCVKNDRSGTQGQILQSLFTISIRSSLIRAWNRDNDVGVPPKSLLKKLSSFWKRHLSTYTSLYIIRRLSNNNCRHCYIIFSHSAYSCASHPLWSKTKTHDDIKWAIIRSYSFSGIWDMIFWRLSFEIHPTALWKKNFHKHLYHAPRNPLWILTKPVQ